MDKKLKECDEKLKTEHNETSELKYLFGALGIVFAVLALQITTIDARILNAPDLIVKNITFVEYNMTINNTNVTFANVTTVVKNIGNEPARNSTTRLNRLNVTIDKFTPELVANDMVEFLDTYQCTVGHNYTSTADVFQVVNESHEDNNQKKVFIDCVV